MNILVTGGAGFIGSNVVESLLQEAQVEQVVVLDNLATGNKANVQAFINHPKYKFIEGDIRNVEDCNNACTGIDLIAHQAALGSVPRSINDPKTSNDVNIGGTLNIFKAAIDNGVKRVTFAASSSTYGDHPDLPKQEDKIGKPLSPYAVTKYVMELYADVFNKTYGLEYIGMRYFNVFGPRQNPNGAYAAVIPLFINKLLQNQAPLINGDGETGRDFTFVANVVEANKRALFTNNPEAINKIYNIAYGGYTTLNQLFDYIKEATNASVVAQYGPERKGDVKQSLASIDKAKSLLDYHPTITAQEGLSKAVAWYKANPNYFL
jgi:UDP-N-acetylglucosamine/UDP-N-acetylgalactosamine 4-epimerase